MEKRTKTAKVHFSKSHQAEVEPAEQRDLNSARGNVQRFVKAGGKDFELYPWGVNNLLPNERVKLLRTNGDAQNLVEARSDFLFGGGFGWFKHSEKAGIVTREPYQDAATKEYEEAYGLIGPSLVVNQMCTSLIETGNIFVNRTMIDKKMPVYSVKDSLICRSTVIQPKKLPVYLLNSDWSNQEGIKNTIAVPSFSGKTEKLTESIIHLKPYQSGQPYYGFAQYWAEETIEWIQVMNFIAKSFNQTVKHNKNIAHICRVATEYFDQMIQNTTTFEGEEYDPEKEKQKVRDEFYDNVEKMIESEDGPRIIFDECTFGMDGKLSGMIQFEEIKRSLDANQLQSAYDTALRAFANASRLLPSLAGVSDGKTIGGSGTELKVSANYQQFFRTPRERQLMLEPFNRDVKRALKLPDDVYAGFFDILLVSDDKNSAGKENKTTQDAGNKDANTSDSTKKEPEK